MGRQVLSSEMGSFSCPVYGSPSSKPTGSCRTTSHVVSPGPIFLETRHLWKGLSHRFCKAVVRNHFSQLGTPEGQGSPTGSLGSITEYEGSWGMQFAKAPGLKITVLKTNEILLLDHLLASFLSTSQRNCQGKLKVRMLTLLSTNRHLMRTEQAGAGEPLTGEAAPAPRQLLRESLHRG